MYFDVTKAFLSHMEPNIKERNESDPLTQIGLGILNHREKKKKKLTVNISNDYFSYNPYTSSVLFNNFVTSLEFL